MLFMSLLKYIDSTSHFITAVLIYVRLNFCCFQIQTHVHDSYIVNTLFIYLFIYLSVFLYFFIYLVSQSFSELVKIYLPMKIYLWHRKQII